MIILVKKKKTQKNYEKIFFFKEKILLIFLLIELLHLPLLQFIKNIIGTIKAYDNKSNGSYCEKQ